MNKLKIIAHKLFRIMGRDFLPYTSDYFVSIRRKKILSSAQINLVLDIGANKGTYAQEIRESSYSGRIVSFEPLAAPFKELKDKTSRDNHWSCENFAIGNIDGVTSMNVSGHETSSSLLSMTQAHVNAMPTSATVAEEKVQIARLDSLYTKYVKPDDRIYMKIDVQGYEREVLKGAPITLEQTHVIEIELSMIPMYEGAPVLMEMLSLLEGMNYQLISISPVFFDAKTGHMLQADGIFVKKDEIQ